MTRDLSDAQLLEGLQDSDARARAALYDAVADEVNQIVWRQLGADPEHDDVVQQVFVNVFAGVSRVRDPASLRGWVAAVAVRTVYAEIRKRRFLRRIWVRREPPEVIAAGADHEGRSLLTQVYRILAALPAAERVAFVLRFVDQRPLAEVARLCDCSVATAKRRIAKAKERFARRAGSDPDLLDRWQRGGRSNADAG